ncbi:MAG: hypothetical protein MR567_05310 [Oscillospiraceae bacterium]|nr:hypothetical protein [Oscillospiraceae bacterium]
MRFLRVLVAVLFAAVLILTVTFRVSVKFDTTKPEITVDTEVIKAKCDVSDEELLKHVKATDTKDGDLTGKVFIESISQFISEGESNVTFCVADNDNNVAKKSVKIVFTDYEAPTLYLADDLVFASDSVINVTGSASVKDKFDGNITDRLSVVVNDEDNDNSRVPINFKVSNSKGFIYRWTIDAVRVDSYSIDNNYRINIGNHLLMLKVGDKKPDFKKMVNSITYRGKTYSDGRIEIDDSALNLSKPGTYDIWFNLFVREDKNGNKSDKYTRITRERMIVICEEKNR